MLLIMIRRLETDNKSFVLVFDVYCPKKTHLRVLGESAHHSNTKYFDFEYGKNGFKGKKTFKIPLPISPKSLNLKVTSLNNKEFKVSNVRSEEIKVDFSKQTTYTKDFILFCCDFVSMCGYKNPNWFFSNDDKFIIKLSKEIVDRKTNKIIDTPARVGMSGFVIELSKNSFDRLSIPQRLFILFHEFGHYYLQTNSEEKADEFAINCFKAMSLPPVESIYAFTRVFRFENRNNPAIESRVKDLLKLLEKHY